MKRMVSAQERVTVIAGLPCPLQRQKVEQLSLRGAMKSTTLFYLLIFSFPLYSSPSAVMVKTAKTFKKMVAEKIVTKDNHQAATIVEKYGAEAMVDLSRSELNTLIRTHEDPLYYLFSGRNILDQNEKAIFAKIFLTEFFENYDANMKLLARRWFDESIDGYNDSKYSRSIEMNMNFLVKHRVKKEDIASSMINHVLKNVKIYGDEIVHKRDTWHPLQLAHGVSKQYDDKVIEVNRYFDHLTILFPEKGIEKVLANSIKGPEYYTSYHSLANKLNFLEDVILNRVFYSTPWASLKKLVGDMKELDEALIKIWRSLIDSPNDEHSAILKNMEESFSKAIDTSIYSAKSGDSGNFEKNLFNDLTFDILVRAADKDESFAKFIYPMVEKHWK